MPWRGEGHGSGAGARCPGISDLDARTELGQRRALPWRSLVAPFAVAGRVGGPLALPRTGWVRMLVLAMGFCRCWDSGRVMPPSVL